MTDPGLIDPEALYDDRALRHALGLAILAAARRSGLCALPVMESVLLKALGFSLGLNLERRTTPPRHEADGQGVHEPRRLTTRRAGPRGAALLTGCGRLTTWPPT